MGCTILELLLVHCQIALQNACTNILANQQYTIGTWNLKGIAYVFSRIWESGSKYFPKAIQSLS